MTAQPRRHYDRKPEPAAVPQRIPDPAPLGDDSATAVSERPHGGRLAYSVDEAARLTGLSRDLLYDEIRRGHLASVKGRQASPDHPPAPAAIPRYRLLRQRPGEPRPSPIAVRHHRQSAPGSSRPGLCGSA